MNFNEWCYVVHLITDVYENIGADEADRPLFPQVGVFFGIVTSLASYSTCTRGTVHSAISKHYTAHSLFIHHHHSLRQWCITVFANGISKGHCRSLSSSTQSWNPFLQAHQFLNTQRLSQAAKAVDAHCGEHSVLEKGKGPRGDTVTNLDNCVTRIWCASEGASNANIGNFSRKPERKMKFGEPANE